MQPGLASIRAGQFAGDRVIYGHSQQTLPSSWPELDALVVSLGPFYACAWCALERSARVSAPVSADPTVLKQLLAFLESAGVLMEPGVRSDRARRSLYDPISWDYRDRWQARDDLERVLSHVLGAWRSSLDGEARLWLWRQLADREAYAYLTSLLSRHRIGARHAEEILAQQDDDWVHLSLGRKRYVLWSSVRGAASEFLSTGGDDQAAIRAMSEEMRNRVRWLTFRESAGQLRRTDFCFLPAPSWRRPLMVDVAMETILTIGANYWLAPPRLLSV